MIPSTTTSKNHGQWKILVVSPGKTAGEQLKPLLEEWLPFSAVTECHDYPDRATLAALLAEQTPSLCFLDVATDREAALPLLDELVVFGGKLPVVALHDANDADFILHTLRQGAAEVLLQPFSTEEFTSVMERLAGVQKADGGQRARVFAVIPAKGSSGATTLACNLAWQLKKAGKERVLLIDLDPLTSTVSFQLKARSSYSFIDALSREGLDADVWRGLVCQSHGFDVLLAPEKPVHGVDETEDIGGLIHFARLLYDAIVLDASGPYGRWSLTMARECDDLLLVTTNELPHLQAAQRALAYLDRHRVDRSSIRVIVSRFSEKMGLNSGVIEAALRHQVYDFLPSEKDTVHNALVEGRLISGNSELARGLRRLAGKLLGNSKREAQPKPSAVAGLFSFLRRKPLPTR